MPPAMPYKIGAVGGDKISKMADVEVVPELAPPKMGVRLGGTRQIPRRAGPVRAGRGRYSRPW